jgi:hypothetical protein
LLPRDDFNRRQIQGQLGLPVPTSAQAYLDDRLALLREELDITNKLAAAGELRDVEITERGLKISPIEDDTPDGAEALRYQAYHLLPCVKITDQLLEVDRWTNFSRMFAHLKTGGAPRSHAVANRDPGRRVQWRLARLFWLVASHIRDETYAKALAKLVDYQHRLPLAAYRGELIVRVLGWKSTLSSVAAIGFSAQLRARPARQSGAL